MNKVTDKPVNVLIIGGGLAGMMAALSARSLGKSVVLASKGLIGKSGNTLVSGGGIAAATDDFGNPPEKYNADLIKSGKGLAKPALARKLADESGGMIERLARLGVRFKRKETGYELRKPPGHSVPRNIPTDWSGVNYLNRGLTYTLPVLEECHRQGIGLIEGVRAIQLLKTDGRVTGAIFQDRAGNCFRICAGSVVLATGGAGYLFARTNNTRDIVGEGLALAAEAGCSLQDMEQVQFYPTMMFHPLKVTVSNPLFGVGAVLRNAAGEEFMSRYDPAGNMATRDNMARAIYLEIQNGGGINGCVHFDCTAIPAAKMQDSFAEFAGFLTALGFDPTKHYLPVSPCVHYCLGGVEIDPECRTSVPGLFAAGEICGGVHGANRLSGAALMEACVFGWQAGQSAATASEKEKSASDDAAVMVRAHFTNGGTELNQLRNILWNKCALVRDERGLKQALSEIKSIKEGRLQRNDISDSEIDKALLVADIIVQCALFRQESRGAHYRSDYPEMRSEWGGNVLCSKETDGKVKLAHTYL